MWWWNLYSEAWRSVKFLGIGGSCLPWIQETAQIQANSLENSGIRDGEDKEFYLKEYEE